MKPSVLDNYKAYEKEVRILQSDRAISLLLDLNNGLYSNHDVGRLDSAFNSEIELLSEAGFITVHDESISLSAGGSRFLSVLGLKVPIPAFGYLNRLTAVENPFLKELERCYQEERLHALRLHRLMTVSTGISFVLISAAIVFTFRGNIAVGLSTICSCLAVQLLIYLSFIGTDLGSKRMAAYVQSMLELQRVEQIFRIAETLEDHSERESIKHEVISKTMQALVITK